MFSLSTSRRSSGSTARSRREILRIGGLAGMVGGSPLTGLAHGQGAAQANSQGDISGIMLFLVGAPSHIDTLDPKPDAPLEVRGPYKPIATAVPGIRVTEILPQVARQADKFSIIRSVYFQGAAVHDTGHQFMQTGRAFTGGIEHPHVGSALNHLKPGTEEIPGHVLIPRPIGKTGGNQPHGQSGGYLGRKYDPFVLGTDPSDPKFKVPDLLPPDYLGDVRVDRRKRLRQVVEDHLKLAETSTAGKQTRESFDQAFRIMASPATREAFDLHKEPDSVRDRYGRTRFGQSCLLARRLVERGVRFVTVNMFETVFDEVTWDIHGSRPFTDINEMARLVAPSFDQGYSALLEDLAQRGMLSKTVVTALGEFGRTPKINPAGGRDHHPGCWSMLVSGGKIRPGMVVGASDELGYAPKSRPANPQMVAATLYKALGVNPHTELTGPQGRPMPLVDHSIEPLNELFGS
jgi:uncharacterized protein (DUF1501 family)